MLPYQAPFSWLAAATRVTVCLGFLPETLSTSRRQNIPLTLHIIVGAGSELQERRGDNNEP
jgi:hypothetical protein